MQNAGLTGHPLMVQFVFHAVLKISLALAQD
jgi:hypothetical protein